MGRLTSPHHILSALHGSRTMNLSWGERPVCLPVRTTSGPSAATRPSPARIASSYSSATERLARTVRPRAWPAAARLVADVAVLEVVALIVVSLVAAGRLDRPESWSGRRPAARGSGTVAGRGRTAPEGVGFRSRRDGT